MRLAALYGVKTKRLHEQVTVQERAREGVRTSASSALGAGGHLLGQVQMAELLGMGALAGLLASVAAMAVGWLLEQYAFE